MDGIGFFLWIVAGGPVIVVLAMPMALLLVLAYRLGRSWALWVVAAVLSLIFFWFFGMRDEAIQGDWQTSLFASFTTIVPPLISAASLTGKIGQVSLWRQTLGAGSAGILTAALPLMISALLFEQWSVRLMAMAALVLTFYLVLRHVLSLRRHRSASLEAIGRPPEVNFEVQQK